MAHEILTLKGTLEGHNGWVTQIATNHNFPNMILSASRGNYLTTNFNILAVKFNETIVLEIF
jgi:hypothetical protein